jgi:hypothetical protein
MVTLRRRIERREFFEPFFVVAQQAGLIIVDEHAGRDVHGIDQAQPLAHAALLHALRDLRRDVFEAQAIGQVEAELMAE